MSVLLLVRHGQASFGKRNYDALSERGHEQSRLLGRALAARGTVPSVIVRGDLVRHRETADGLVAGLTAAGVAAPSVVADGEWDELDFQHVMEVHKPMYRSRALMLADYARTPGAKRKARFQAMFEEATARWTSGTADADYHETFAAFSARVDAALNRATAWPDETVLVVSSGGPIGLVASRLLAGDSSLWAPLNRAAVNTGLTKVVRGSSGLTLSTYNDHGHLERDRELITYR